MSEWLSRASSGMDVEVEQSAVILSAFDLILSDMLISIFSWQNMMCFFLAISKILSIRRENVVRERKVSRGID